MPFIPDVRDLLDAANQQQAQRLSGTVPPTSLADAQLSADGRGARYDIFGCTVSYEYDEGLLQCPVAAGATAAAFTPTAQEAQPPSNLRTPSSFVRVHAPAARKVVTYYGKRTGAWPRLPAPTLDDANLVLLSTQTVPEVPILDEGGGLYIFGCHVVHTYGLVRPVTNQDGFAVGAAPHTAASLSDNELSPSEFFTGIIG